MNPLKDLRERKRFTRQQMGDPLGLKAPSIDKYESDMGAVIDIARRPKTATDA